MQGVINSYDPQAGFGFVWGQDGTTIFFHISNVERGSEIESIPTGCLVEYEVRRRARGKNVGKSEAIKIRFVED